MEGDIKCKTMNAYKKDIVRFQTYLTERRGEARVSNHLLDPCLGTTDFRRDQALELINYARELAKDSTLTPSAFDEQFYAIRKHMVTNVRNIDVFSEESVTTARKIARATVTVNRKRVIEEMSATERSTYDARYGVKVPFTVEMMEAHRRDYFENPAASIEDQMAYMATALAYHVGNRPSENSSNGRLQTNESGKADEDHRYITEDIQYQLADNSFITGPDINGSNIDEIQYISVMVDTHKGETIKSLSTKGTPKRQSNAIRKDNGAMELQLFHDMIAWPRLAQLRPEDKFFSRNGKGKNLKLTTKAMTERMKTTASNQGIDPALISAKSLRKTLGTDLTRSGIPTGTINSIGRWSANSKVCATNYAMANANNITGTMSEGVKRSSNTEITRLSRSRSVIVKEATQPRALHTPTQGIGGTKDGLASTTDWGGRGQE